ncbi:MAG: ABC transporter permease [Nocardiopsaceae bacterium]|jgi:peptide/nickel transport system permease protein|nr:ABC transporter permease [Nocardiopsaceae bacterium]
MTELDAAAIGGSQVSGRRVRAGWVPASVGLSMLLLLFIVVCAIAPGLVAPHADHQDILLGVTGPGTAGHLLGTDDLGRDIVQLTLGGTQSAVLGPVAIALGSMLLGVLFGTTAGYRGGILDGLIARWADLLLALPAVLLAIVVAGILGGSYWITVAILVVLFSPSDIRLIRGVVIEQKTQPYIESARVLRMPAWRIMYRQILPNVVPVIIANFMLNIAYAIVAMSSLSYLGLGVGPGSPDWGRQLSDAQDILAANPAAILAPGILIVLTATAINILGDWLFDWFNARVAAQ